MVDFLMGALKMSEEVRVAVVIVCVTAVVLAAFKLFNPANGAEHYYKQRNKAAFRALQVSYFVIAVALAFNVRFLVVQASREAMARAGI
jgi:hypothetical protein